MTPLWCLLGREFQIYAKGQIFPLLNCRGKKHGCSQFWSFPNINSASSNNKHHTICCSSLTLGSDQVVCVLDLPLHFLRESMFPFKTAFLLHLQALRDQRGKDTHEGSASPIFYSHTAIGRDQTWILSCLFSLPYPFLKSVGCCGSSAPVLIFGSLFLLACLLRGIMWEKYRHHPHYSCPRHFCIKIKGIYI